MTIDCLMTKLDAKCLNKTVSEREVECGYAGDLLSFVIGKAPSGCAWFTVMNNVNVCAVATLADVAVVVLCEGVQPDEMLLEKAQMQNVNILCTEYDIYTAINIASQNMLLGGK